MVQHCPCPVLPGTASCNRARAIRRLAFVLTVAVHRHRPAASRRARRPQVRPLPARRLQVWRPPALHLPVAIKYRKIILLRTVVWKVASPTGVRRRVLQAVVRRKPAEVLPALISPDVLLHGMV